MACPTAGTLSTTRAIWSAVKYTPSPWSAAFETLAAFAAVATSRPAVASPFSRIAGSSLIPDVATIKPNEAGVVSCCTTLLTPRAAAASWGCAAAHAGSTALFGTIRDESRKLLPAAFNFREKLVSGLASSAFSASVGAWKNVPLPATTDIGTGLYGIIGEPNTRAAV